MYAHAKYIIYIKSIRTGFLCRLRGLCQLCGIYTHTPPGRGQREGRLSVFEIFGFNFF